MEIAEVNAAYPEIFSVFFFLIGACVGSFLNVCVYRIAAGKSIVNPPSHCACGAPIEFYNNIPILSWFLLRGKASCCGAKISFRYPLVEILTALIFLGMWLLLPLEKACVGMAFGSLMVFCTFYDIDTMTLPDFATVGGIILGFVLSMLLPEIHDACKEGLPRFAQAISSGIVSAIGIIVGAGVVYLLRLFGGIIFKREAMGEGDIILAACIGAFCGWQGAIFCVFGGSVIGAIVMLPLVLLQNIFRKKSAVDTQSCKADKKLSGAVETSSRSEDCAGEESGEAEGAIPFGPWLALGGLLYYMFFYESVDLYFSTFQKLFF